MHIRLADITQEVFDVVKMIVLLWSIIANIPLWIVHKFYAIRIIIVRCIYNIVVDLKFFAKLQQYYEAHNSLEHLLAL